MTTNNTTKPKLKPKRRRTLLLIYIEDIIRLAKPFRISVELNERECIKVIRQMQYKRAGDKGYEVRIDETPPPRYIIHAFSTGSKGKTVRATIIGYVIREPNMRTTTLVGKTYTDFWVGGILWFTFFLLLLMGREELSSQAFIIFAVFFVLVFIVLLWTSLSSRNEIFHHFIITLKNTEQNILNRP